jgi:hypothetical protein
MRIVPCQVGRGGSEGGREGGKKEGRRERGREGRREEMRVEEGTSHLLTIIYIYV